MLPPEGEHLDNTASPPTRRTLAPSSHRPQVDNCAARDAARITGTKSSLYCMPARRATRRIRNTGNTTRSMVHARPNLYVELAFSTPTLLQFFPFTSAQQPDQPRPPSSNSELDQLDQYN